MCGILFVAKVTNTATVRGNDFVSTDWMVFIIIIIIIIIIISSSSSSSSSSSISSSSIGTYGWGEEGV